MARIAIYFLVAAIYFLVVLCLQLDEKFQFGSNKTSAQKYYPSDSLNMVTLGVVNGTKYFFSNQETTWFEASYFCNAHGMDLASIETQHENYLIMEQITKIGFETGLRILAFNGNDVQQHCAKCHECQGMIENRIWISGHRIGRSTWLWINGDFILFTDWETGQPSDQAIEHCINILNNKWHDDECVNAWPEGGFICEERVVEYEMEQIGIYPDDLFNMVSLDNSTEKLYLFSHSAADWFEAAYFCNAYGMDLVNIETQTENELILKHIENSGMNQSKEYWASGHKIGRSSWRWMNGLSMSFSDWAPGEPQQPINNQCLYIYLGDWYSRICYVSSSLKTAFICETRDILADDVTKTTNFYPTENMTMMTLGPGNGTKYLFADQLTSWFEASYFCNVHGMDLVTMETEVENEAIMSHIEYIGTSYVFWTSGHKIGRATYLWINGAFMLYNDWAIGEPLDYRNDCMMLLNDGWYDNNCYHYMFFICEERIAAASENPPNSASARGVRKLLLTFSFLPIYWWRHQCQ